MDLWEAILPEEEPYATAIQTSQNPIHWRLPSPQVRHRDLHARSLRGRVVSFERLHGRVLPYRETLELPYRDEMGDLSTTTRLARIVSEN